MSESMFKRPAVVPFVECPNCKQLMEYGLKSCPRCREEISADYAFTSAVIVHHNTQAVSSANTIKTAEPGTVIIFFASLIGYFTVSPSMFIVNLITPTVYLLIILVWFYRYGRFKIGDEEYVRAKRDMWKSLKLWLAVLAAQVIVVIYMLKTSHPIN